jgi:Pheophorbide a oxygenase
MQTAALPNKKLKLAKMKPVWLDHLGRSELLDGDAIFLHRVSQDLTSGVFRHAHACEWSGPQQQAACSIALQRVPASHAERVCAIKFMLSPSMHLCCMRCTLLQA